jgi:acyl-coenzyme A synthetase/AMP-(fatty) acid ligase
LLLVDGADYAARLAALPSEYPERPVAKDDLFLLIFTSGPTDLPKAVRCTTGRFAGKQRPRRQAWRAEQVWWRAGKGEALRPLEPDDRSRLDPLLPE